MLDAIAGTDTSPALNLTPAQVEQLSAEHDLVEDMVAALEAKLHTVVATTTAGAAATVADEKSPRRRGAPAPPAGSTDGLAEPSAPALLFPTRTATGTVTYE